VLQQEALEAEEEPVAEEEAGQLPVSDEDDVSDFGFASASASRGGEASSADRRSSGDQEQVEEQGQPNPAAATDAVLLPEGQRLLQSPLPHPLPEHFEHSVQGILRAIESTGHAEAPQPAAMSLRLFPLQRQTLRRLLDMETRDLHEELWQQVQVNAPVTTTYRCAVTGAHRRGSRPPAVYGGLLCDEPGFGKTQMLIALILAHPRPQGSAGPCGTLVVVPKRLLTQWHAELIKAQANGVAAHLHLRVREHLPPSDELALSLADVVLTTPERLRAEAKCLCRIGWWRVVFDEASKHFSKSLTSNLLEVALKLPARNRWLLSGTPITRAVRSLHGQMAFLGVELGGLIVTGRTSEGCDNDEWWGRFDLADQSQRPLQGLLTLLKATAIRHTHDQRYAVPTDFASEGRLIRLPPKEVELRRIEFGAADASHRLVYESMAHLARLEHGEPSKPGTRGSGRGSSGSSSSSGGSGSSSSGSSGSGSSGNGSGTFPANRKQELILCASHPATVDLGPVAMRVAELQITEYDSLTTRLCSHDEIIESFTSLEASPLRERKLRDDANAYYAVVDATMQAAEAQADADADHAPAKKRRLQEKAEWRARWKQRAQDELDRLPKPMCHPPMSLQHVEKLLCARFIADDKCPECEQTCVERVVVPDCFHSYCKGCLHKMLGSGTVPCKHPECGGGGGSGRTRGYSSAEKGVVLQRGLLRQLASKEEVERREQELDPTPSWQQLDKRLAAVTSELRVSVCDSNRCEMAGALQRRDHSQQFAARMSSCLDDRLEVRNLSHTISAPRPLEQVMLPATGPSVGCIVCLGHHPGKFMMPCGAPQQGHTPCSGRFCRTCIKGWRAQAANFNCPQCRAAPDNVSLCFCSESCARSGFNLRIEPVECRNARCGDDECGHHFSGTGFRCAWRCANPPRHTAPPEAQLTP